jgi:hypothetical protein
MRMKMKMILPLFSHCRGKMIRHLEIDPAKS